METYDAMTEELCDVAIKEFVRCAMSGEDLDRSHLGIRTENAPFCSSPACSALNLGRKLRHLVHAPI